MGSLGTRAQVLSLFEDMNQEPWSNLELSGLWRLWFGVYRLGVSGLGFRGFGFRV